MPLQCAICSLFSCVFRLLVHSLPFGASGNHLLPILPLTALRALSASSSSSTSSKSSAAKATADPAVACPQLSAAAFQLELRRGAAFAARVLQFGRSLGEAEAKAASSSASVAVAVDESLMHLIAEAQALNKNLAL